MAGERSVAQSGSALGWGPRGHRFKSCRSDFVDATVCDVMRVVCVCPGRAVQRPSRTMLMQMRSYVLGENPFVFFSVSTQPCATSCASFAFVPDAPVQRRFADHAHADALVRLGRKPVRFFLCVDATVCDVMRVVCVCPGCARATTFVDHAHADALVRLGRKPVRFFLCAEGLFHG